MECNRDEALRAKAIAEGKIEKRDFAGAKKFASKAQNLFPGLDGISQLLTTLDVYVSAENKISGEIDWYGVLGVNPSADDETMKKQYRKLVLMLHPDKNKSVGADGAFKLVSEAWSLLSDKAKRLAYNQRRGFRGVHQKVQMHATGGPSASSNGIFNHTNRTTSVPKPQNNSATSVPKVPSPTPPPVYQRTDTFWTICHRCKMHYEYLKVYLNQTLLCPHCKEAFMASETSPPFNFSKSQNQVPKQRQHTPTDRAPSRNTYVPPRNVPGAQNSGPGQTGANSFRYHPYQQNPLSGSVGIGNTDPSIAAKAANVVQQAQDKLKRAYTETHTSAGWEGSVKKSKLEDAGNQYGGLKYNMPQGTFGTASGSALGSRIYGFSAPYRQPNSTRDLTTLETRSMLSRRALKDILDCVRLNTTVKVADKEKDMTKESKNEKQRSITDVEVHDHNRNSDLSDRPRKGKVSHSADNKSKEESAAALMSVPDPDFHDFDEDRAESSFGDNEVWAAYDDDDGMPRFYALVNKVISRKPFKLRISWLNSKTNSEFSTMDWVGSGFYKTCGEFRVGRYEICKSINSFSQKVNWSKGPRGSILILPQKDDVWAVYKNWSSDWNQHTPDEVIHKYDMVTVLDDYNEEQGVRIAPLVKVAGFRTVFRPNLDPQVIKKIPKEEMFRFSHRVPYHLLTGVEAQNAPKGCLELDPAATPLELLQGTTEGNETPTAPNAAPSVYCKEESRSQV